MNPVYFYLNIGAINDTWTVPHAIREFIANSIDETTLSGVTQNPEFTINGNTITIRDYGRGIQPKHFVLDQQDEKLKSNQVIGKFGVGVKDAISVLISHKKIIQIFSKHARFGFAMKPKHGFTNIYTLHGVYASGIDSMVGT